MSVAGDEPDLAGTDEELWHALVAVERAIALVPAFRRIVDESGHVETRVTAGLMAWAQREHLLVTELRRRQITAAAPPTRLDDGSWTRGDPSEHRAGESSTSRPRLLRTPTRDVDLHAVRTVTRD